MKIILISLPLIAALFLSWHYVHADESPVTQCGPGRGHDCHCPRMVQRRRDAAEQACYESSGGDKKKLDECLEVIPTTCQMVAHPQVNPENGELSPDTCFKYCKYQGLCFCHDTRCDANGDPLPQAPPKMPPLPKGKKK